LEPRERKWRKPGEDCIMSSSTKYYYGDQDKEDGMGGIYSTDGRDEK